MTSLELSRVLTLLGAILALLWWPVSVKAQTALLEVDKGDVKLMQVNDDGGFVVRGTEAGAIPASGSGTRLMWYPSQVAFRVGAVSGAQWDAANIGGFSVAMGLSTTANGTNSTAMGWDTKATGPSSTAMGQQTTASGHGSSAMGINTTASTEASTAMGINTLADGTHATALGAGTRASGNESTAMGTETKALGARSTAMGFRTTAAGDQSMVMGSNAQTFAAGVGSFVYGDAAGTTAISSVFPNEFLVRASGGFQFRTSPNLSTGCNLPAGSGTFDCTSSRLAKVDFEDVDGETVLGKLAAIRIQRWRYRGTDASHVGPTAEDFHAAFDVGQGPTTISTVDADGISLLAIQALERRTAELREENAALRAKLTEDTAALRTELEALRRIVETGRVAP
jgi:hypothetical protein